MNELLIERFRFNAKSRLQEIGKYYDSKKFNIVLNFSVIDIHSSLQGQKTQISQEMILMREGQGQTAVKLSNKIEDNVSAGGSCRLSIIIEFL